MKKLLLAILAVGTLSGCKTFTNQGVFVKSEWQLRQLQALPIEHAPYPTLKFDDYKVFGNNGCNSYFGSIIGEEEAFEFKGIGTTKMACLGDGIMLLEMNYNQMLQKARKVQVKNSLLEVFDKDGNKIAVYSALSK